MREVQVTYKLGKTKVHDIMHESLNKQSQNPLMPVLFFFYMSYFDSPKGRQQSGEQLGARLRHIGERQLRGPDEVE